MTQVILLYVSLPGNSRPWKQLLVFFSLIPLNCVVDLCNKVSKDIRSEITIALWAG